MATQIQSRMPAPFMMLCSISGTLPEEDVDVPSAETSTLSLLAAVRR